MSSPAPLTEDGWIIQESRGSNKINPYYNFLLRERDLVVQGFQASGMPFIYTHHVGEEKNYFLIDLPLPSFKKEPLENHKCTEVHLRLDFRFANTNKVFAPAHATYVFGPEKGKHTKKAEHIRVHVYLTSLHWISHITAARYKGTVFQEEVTLSKDADTAIRLHTQHTAIVYLDTFKTIKKNAYDKLAEDYEECVKEADKKLDLENSKQRKARLKTLAKLETVRLQRNEYKEYSTIGVHTRHAELHSRIVTWSPSPKAAMVPSKALADPVSSVVSLDTSNLGAAKPKPESGPEERIIALQQAIKALLPIKTAASRIQVQPYLDDLSYLQLVHDIQLDEDFTSDLDTILSFEDCFKKGLVADDYDAENLLALLPYVAHISGMTLFFPLFDSCRLSANTIAKCEVLFNHDEGGIYREFIYWLSILTINGFPYLGRFIIVHHLSEGFNPSEGLAGFAMLLRQGFNPNLVGVILDGEPLSLLRLALFYGNGYPEVLLGFGSIPNYFAKMGTATFSIANSKSFLAYEAKSRHSDSKTIVLDDKRFRQIIGTKSYRDACDRFIVPSELPSDICAAVYAKATNPIPLELLLLAENTPYHLALCLACLLITNQIYITESWHTQANYAGLHAGDPSAASSALELQEGTCTALFISSENAGVSKNIQGIVEPLKSRWQDTQITDRQIIFDNLINGAKDHKAKGGNRNQACLFYLAGLLLVMEKDTKLELDESKRFIWFTVFCILSLDAMTELSMLYNQVHPEVYSEYLINILIDFMQHSDYQQELVSYASTTKSFKPVLEKVEKLQPETYRLFSLASNQSSADNTTTALPAP